ncbi:unnamed protein product [Heligmosomoides polygyrus]|uniref:Secreted protein n=1 Tax=Heligmosomoides polygyrus TaxID=6339 RepID=A0A183FXW1_HELPZ|nr:unnamed protein product [Heligmosomoides polygyrus]
MRGLPWVVAVTVIVVLMLSGLLVYYVASENVIDAIPTAPSVAFLNYQVESPDQDDSSIEHYELIEETITERPSLRKNSLNCDQYHENSYMQQFPVGMSIVPKLGAFNEYSSAIDSSVIGFDYSAVI